MSAPDGWWPAGVPLSFRGQRAQLFRRGEEAVVRTVAGVEHALPDDVLIAVERKKTFSSAWARART